MYVQAPSYRCPSVSRAGATLRIVPQQRCVQAARTLFISPRNRRGSHPGSVCGGRYVGSPPLATVQSSDPTACQNRGPTASLQLSMTRVDKVKGSEYAAIHSRACLFLGLSERGSVGRDQRATNRSHPPYDIQERLLTNPRSASSDRHRYAANTTLRLKQLMLRWHLHKARSTRHHAKAAACGDGDP